MNIESKDSCGNFSNIILCERHGDLLLRNENNGKFQCESGCNYDENNGIIFYTVSSELEEISEVNARDRQSKGYLSHSKFPIQIFRFGHFLKLLSERQKKLPALDLGCGPGPTTKMLLENGLDVVAVDFSYKSLLINFDTTKLDDNAVCFVQADLNKIKLKKSSTGVLVMADFLQHLGEYQDQKDFMHKAIATLVPGGIFYLSFFNTNIKNYLKDDINGSFCGGDIPYRRLSTKEVVDMLPRNIRVLEIQPMNIVHNVFFDKLFCAIPFLRNILARMIVIVGINERNET